MSARDGRRAGRGSRGRAGLRLAAVAAVLLLGAPLARAQEDTRDEFWPEIDGFVQLDERTRLFLLGSLAKNADVDLSEATVGVHADFSLAPIARKWLRDTPDVLRKRYLSFRVGYRYGWDLTTPREYEEHRLVFEVTGRFAAPGRTLLSNRNRLDLRKVDGESSWRFRERLRLEKDFALGRRTITPYVMAEVFWDSRYDAWTRQRYHAGVEWSLAKSAVLDTSYCRQNDSRASVAHVDAVGLALSLYF